MRKTCIIIGIIFSLAFALIFKNFLFQLGFSPLSTLHVSIEEKLSGKLLLVYQPLIEIGEQQKIYVEFINTGTNQITAKIEMKVYGYVDGKLKPLAYYYDISVPLNPGMRRGYSSVFVPPSDGAYYIQAKAYYDTKVIETWGSFYVRGLPPEIIPIYPSPGPVPPPIIIPAPTPDLSLDYPSSVKFYSGERKLISITAKNVGNATLHNLRLYISSHALINFSVYPKVVSSLDLKESVIFILSVEIPLTIEVGTYPLEFELASNEIVKRGEISIEVSSIPVPEEEEIYQKILNYEFLIYEIQQQINSAFFKGYDVGIANRTLQNARISLESAKSYFKYKRYDDAKNELKKVEKNIEDSALQLATLTLYIYRPPAILWWVVLLIILAVIALLVLAYWYLKKKRRKRPRLLERLGETEK